MKAVFADTAFFLAALNTRDALHDKALELSRALAARQRVTTVWVLTEVANALALADQRGFVVELVAALKSHPKVRILPASQELFERGFEMYGRYRDKDWSLTDCISFVVMEAEGITEALTSDHHFEQAGFTILMKE